MWQLRFKIIKLQKAVRVFNSHIICNERRTSQGRVLSEILITTNTPLYPKTDLDNTTTMLDYYSFAVE